jgi:hypothetical protein
MEALGGADTTEEGGAAAGVPAPEQHVDKLEQIRTRITEAFQALDKALFETAGPLLTEFCAAHPGLACGRRSVELLGSSSAGKNREMPIDESMYRCTLRCWHKIFPDVTDIPEAHIKHLQGQLNTAVRPHIQAFADANAGLMPDRRLDVTSVLTLGKNHEVPADTSFLRFCVRLTAVQRGKEVSTRANIQETPTP